MLFHLMDLNDSIYMLTMFIKIPNGLTEKLLLYEYLNINKNRV